MFRFPFGTTQELNLDWFLEQWEIFKQEAQTALDGIDHALDDEIQRVEDAMTDLYAARDAAIAAKNNALDYAQSANNSAIGASQSAQNSAASAVTSAQQAQSAAQQAQSAAQSATSAQGSATNAGTSAGNALTQAQQSEAWATGEIGGVHVPPTAPQNLSNAKQYSINAGLSANAANTAKNDARVYSQDSKAWATGIRNGQPVTSEDETYQNNAKYYAESIAGDAAAAAESASDAAASAASVGQSAAQIAQNTSDISNLKNSTYNLLRGVGIESGADLNDYTTPGTYYVGSAAAAAAIINGPIKSTSYKLIVENTISTSRIKQTAILNSDKAGFERYYNGASWSVWKRYAFVEPVNVFPKWEIGNISQSAPWNTISRTVARTALDCIPIGEKTIVKYDSTLIKVSMRLYNQQGKYLVQASGSSTYFDNYDYSANWNTSGEITITADNTIRYYRLCAAYINGDEITNPADIGNRITIEKYGTTKEFCVDIESVPVNAENSIDRSRPQFGTICAIKELHRQNEQDKTVGYLYRDNKAPFNFYYSSGTPENPKKIFTWDATKTDTGAREPIDYCFAVTEEGDVIAVFRGEINGDSNQSGAIRGNPIVYPHDDYNNPVVVDLSAATQPTSWLMNTGVYCEHGAMYFVEYTRPRHSQAYLWKVTAPYTSAADWGIKYTYNTTSIEHWHHITRDPFTQIMYASTGDADLESKILYSTDDGNNWAVLREGDQKICRQLNFVFLEDAIYWATDAVSTSAPRVLCKTTRDANGLMKLSDSDVEILFTFNNYVAFATYHVCYIENPSGLLLLERSDSKNASYIGTFFFWDFATSRMYYAGNFEPNGNVYVGFRNEAVSHYPALPDDNTVVCGFSMFPNEIKFRGNPSVAEYLGNRGMITSDAYNDNVYNNLLLTVKQMTDYHYNGNH